MIAAQLL